MEKGTDIHILHLGKLRKLLSYLDSQVCIPRKVAELRFENKSLTLKDLSFYPAVKQFLIVFRKWTAVHTFDLLFRRHSCIFINNVSISPIIKFLLARSSV